ncbi:xylose isomerase, partial [Candidatus Epulonipiscioides saccharophilum]
GVHLSFYPMWIDFYKGDMTKVINLLGDQDSIIKYYGGLDKQAIIDSYEHQFERAKQLDPEYMVFHVCNSNPIESLTYKFDYTNLEVINYTLDLVNNVFKGYGPSLLFENLWWPGLTFLNKVEAKYLLDKTEYSNKGFVLDISHLILTNKNISTEHAAYKYIMDVVNKLDMLKKSIKVVHLNKTLPKYYFEQDWNYKLERYLRQENHQRKVEFLKEHIKKMDPHLPFEGCYAKKIIDLVEPEFCVYETSPNSINQFNFYVKIQNEALRS